MLIYVLMELHNTLDSLRALIVFPLVVFAISGILNMLRLVVFSVRAIARP